MKSKFFKNSKKYQRELKKFIQSNFGKKCGHIGKDEISLDCVVCKLWLSYEFLSWLIDNIDDIEKQG